jgi:hypothetical protein
MEVQKAADVCKVKFEASLILNMGMKVLGFTESGVI